MVDGGNKRRVGIHGELDVHVQHAVWRHHEGVVGAAATFDGVLLFVVCAFDETCGAQHVFGHSLAPLAASLRTGEHVVEIGRALHQIVDGTVDVAELLGVLVVQALDFDIHLLHALAEAFLHAA